MENVLLAANQRLAWMTRGRYSLQAVGKGLELEVRDHLSGQLRPLTTLSGGESFLASLGLALGLTDSLSYGGAAGTVEALFIDEGFGNLDEEALELALQSLLQLRQEGRLVGVVSHLPELRERIHARLEVQAGPAGSRVQVSMHR
jgi:exonuclease SbcC